MIDHPSCGAAFDRRILAGYLAEDLCGLGLGVPNLGCRTFSGLFAIYDDLVVFSRL